MPLLDWVNRNQAEETANNVPYHLLNFEQSYGDEDKAKNNLIIQGDNLEALKALLPLYGGQVKCIFIDPPYNTQSAFEHYDDKLEHSQWLSVMYPRMQLLKNLLAEDGSIWITLDDSEVHYFKVMCDEVFGRSNFINQISLNMKNVAGASGGGEDKKLKKNIEYLLVYAKNYEVINTFKKQYKYTPLIELIEDYRNTNISWKYTTILIDEGRKEYIGSTVDGSGDSIVIYKRIDPVFKTINAVMKEENISEEKAYEKYATKLFQTAMPQSSIRPRVMEKVEELEIDHDFFSIEYVPRSGRNKGKMYEQFYKGKSFRLLAWLRDVLEVIDEKLYKKDELGTYWDLVKDTKNLTKEGGVKFPNGKKPEQLIYKVLEMCTVEEDLVLDSFLGSGTTCAVAHKMNRRYIGIEMTENFNTHVVPRLKRVIKGEQGGVSSEVGWKGGGGFSSYTLGSAVFDEQGFLHPDVKFPDLASYVWWLENRTAFISKSDISSPFLGVHEGVAYYLLYNGILGDKRPNGGNVLTNPILKYLNECHQYEGKRIIIGEASRIGLAKLETLNIEFKQIPYALYGSHAK